MYKRAVVFSLLIIVALAACSSPEAEQNSQATTIAAEIYATQTAQAPPPTATATFTPIPSPTITPTATITPYPLPTGWRDHAAADFQLGLPGRWEAVDVDQEGVDAIWDLLAGINTEWAESVTSLFSSEAMREAIKFWALDTEPAGSGYASLNIIPQTQAYAIPIEDLCSQIPAAYQQLQIDMIESDCSLKINGLEAARFMTGLNMGELGVRQYQYIFVRGVRVWTLTFSVDSTVWDRYEEIFVTAAETFRTE